jgi:hypothetical protein
MADSFDLLDQLGDQKKVENLKAKIEKKKSSDVLLKLDKIESEIEKAAQNNQNSEEIISNIINSNFATLNGDVDSTEADLQELMLHLRSMLDSCGGEFSKLQELNDSELKLVAAATEARNRAEIEAKDAEGMSDLWNILFGYKNRKIKNTKVDFDKKIAGLKAAEEEANRRYRDRLKNADIGESLNRIISQVQGMVGIVENMILDVEEQIVALKNRKELAFETKEKAARIIHLEAQTTTKNNLKQLIGQLKSDTEERVTTYESGLQLIQSATAQEAASIYEEAGVKTDQKITEIAAKVFVGSEKDRIERIKKQPERMAALHEVLKAMAEATAKYKEEDAKIVEEHSRKFGIDVSETFSYKYENKEGDGDDPKPNPKKDGSDSVNDLLD